jgi:hypothetical protein
MTWRHPFRAMNHLWDKLRQVEHPMKARQKLRRQRDTANP